MFEFFNFEVLYSAFSLLYKNGTFLLYFFNFEDFYLLENLLKENQLNYVDTYFSIKFNNEKFKSAFIFEHFNNWIKIYLKINHVQLYPLQPVSYQLINEKNFLFNIVFSDYFFSKEKIFQLTNLSLNPDVKTSSLKVINTSLFSSIKDQVLLTNNNFTFNFFFIYNPFDFEVFLHSIFSMWYPYSSVGLEDFILSSQTSVYNELDLAEDYSYFLKNLFIDEDSYINDYFFINNKKVDDFYSFWFNNLDANDTTSFYSYELCYNSFEKSLKNTEFQNEANNYFKNFK